MKQARRMLDEILDDRNLDESFRYVLRGRKRKESLHGKHFLANKEQILSKVKDDITNMTFHITGYHEMIINERGKERVIQSVPYYERVVLNAVMKVVERHLIPKLIKNTAASIKGRGMHMLYNTFKKDLENDPEGTRVAYQIDIKKFYKNVDQELMMEVVKRYIGDKYVLDILDKSIHLLPTGLSIGLRTSQFLANLYLSYYLDHIVKDVYKVKYFYRYCDDVLVLCSSFEEAKMIKGIIHDCISKAKLTIKPNEKIFYVEKRPIDFLGFVTFADRHSRIRKHIKQRFAKRWSRVKSRERRHSLISSFYGIAKHGNCNNLFYKLTGVKMSNFADLGIHYERTDGKKQYNCESKKISDLVNIPITVIDYESDVKTGKGEGRTIILFRHQGDKDNKEFKTVTSSVILKQLLDKIKDANAFPCDLTIKRQSLGDGKSSYTFV